MTTTTITTTTTTTVAPPKSRPNQRRCRRQAPKSSAKVKAFRNTLGLGPNLASNLLDVSEEGARLLLQEQIATGTECEVNFECLGKKVKLVARVIWTIEAADGRFVTGVQFQKTLNYADLQALSRT